jgi:transcription termination factor Rho
MTEPNLSLTGEPPVLPAAKRTRKRASSAASIAPASPPATQPQAVKPRPPAVESTTALKKRARPAARLQTTEPVEEAPVEKVAKKRATRRTAATTDAALESTRSPSVKEQQPQEQTSDSGPASTQVRSRRKKEAAARPTLETSAPEPEIMNEAPTRPQDNEGPRPRSRRERPGRPSGDAAPKTPPAAVQAAGAPEDTEPPVHTATDAGDASERARKPYPVYVPLHIAKQMEQEGRPAPLALAPDAQQAEAVRAAALESRHSSPQPQSEAQTVFEGEPREQPERREGQRHEGHPQQHHRHERGQHQHPNQRHDRNQRNPQRGPGPERGRDGRHNDRHRNREDRRNHNQPGGYQESHRDQHQHQELAPPTPEELFPGGGVIEISGKGFGFLRDPLRNFAQHPADIFVSPEMVRRFNLRDGQMIQGSVRKSGRGQQMHEITSVNEDPPEASKHQPAFDELTVINPCEPLQMATVPERYTTRIIDMLTPIGKGQRGLIVAQPRTGKTTFLQHIADAMVKNHPDVKLIILLVDERPEEVTEIRHTVPSAEIMASSNDMDVRSHTRIAELAIERAKRLVEAGKDVFILLDSITRLGRAFNNALSNGGRTMSGGLDARALETPRKLFAAARNTEEAGSLTIIATALIDTGSRMDEIIFQEFKGTGNMELVLDRKIAESRIYPAVDIFQSGTRREELLVPADLLQKIHFLRRGLSGARPMDAIDRLLSYLKKFQTNEQMLREIRG